MAEEGDGQPVDARVGGQAGPQRAVACHHEGRVDALGPQPGEGVQGGVRLLLRGQPGAHDQQHLRAARVPVAHRLVVVGGVAPFQVHAERGPYDVAGADPLELRRGPGGGAHHLGVGQRGTAVEGVGGAAGGAGRQAPGAEHSVGALVRDHHRGDAVPAGPFAGPAQGGAVGDLQPVRPEGLQQCLQGRPAGQQPVAAGARDLRSRQGDDPSLCGEFVAAAGAGDDQHGFVAGSGVPLAEVPQRGAQAAGDGGDEVGEPDDAQAPLRLTRVRGGGGGGAHAATAWRSTRTWA